MCDSTLECVAFRCFHAYFGISLVSIVDEFIHLSAFKNLYYIHTKSEKYIINFVGLVNYFLINSHHFIMSLPLKSANLQ